MTATPQALIALSLTLTAVQLLHLQLTQEMKLKDQQERRTPTLPLLLVPKTLPLTLTPGQLLHLHLTQEMKLKVQKQRKKLA
jgi:hypothetical protein